MERLLSSGPWSARDLPPEKRSEYWAQTLTLETVPLACRVGVVLQEEEGAPEDPVYGQVDGRELKSQVGGIYILQPEICDKARWVSFEVLLELSITSCPTADRYYETLLTLIGTRPWGSETILELG